MICQQRDQNASKFSCAIQRNQAIRHLLKVAQHRPRLQRELRVVGQVLGGQEKLLVRIVRDRVGSGKVQDSTIPDLAVPEILGNIRAQRKVRQHGFHGIFCLVLAKKLGELSKGLATGHFQSRAKILVVSFRVLLDKPGREIGHCSGLI
jgi:hypothetical protein